MKSRGFLIFSLIIKISTIATDSCNEYEICDQCIQAKIEGGCDWCFKEKYTGPRCFQSNAKSSCDPDFTYPHVERSYDYELIDDKDFMNVIDPDNKEEAVQIKPQRIKIKLIPKTATSFTFKYRLAENYPLDLYYLTDLTLTMEKDITTLASLSTDLTQVLQNLTKHYQVAYGYYSDKVAIPFSKLTPAFVENPCVTLKHVCQRAFAFVHTLNFTENVNEFIDKVKASRTTANIDNLEGGMEALLQVILCEKLVKWRENSRKIVVIATDGTMHFAGDGKLTGSVKRNPGICALDHQGIYTKSLLYDYPSLEQIHRELIKHKMSVLFVVKQDVYKYYTDLSRQIPEVSYIGKLQDRSKNVLELVKEGYLKVVRTVKFTWNQIEGLDVNFHSSCNKPEYEFKLNRTDTCEDVNVGEEFTFNVTLEIEEIPKNRTFDILTIEEQDIAEKLTIEIEYLGKCDCEYKWLDSKKKRKMCNDKGEFVCGKCFCEDQWKGDTCEKHCSEESIIECREINSTYTSSTCYTHGDCECGTCICEYDYMGKYCQYKQCPRNRHGDICSGPRNGICVKGACNCFPDNTGEDCACSLSMANCIAPGSRAPCNGVGNCTCGRCECPSLYKGEFCEFCPECTGLCTNYDRCVLDLADKGKADVCVGNDNSTIYQVRFVDSEPDGENKCFNRYQPADDTYCDLYYTYEIKNKALVELQIFKNCRKTMKAAVLGSIITGAVLAIGFLILMCYKAKIWREERLEYQRFERELKSSKRGIGVNPLYKSPISTYTVPASFLEDS